MSEIMIGSLPLSQAAINLAVLGGAFSPADIPGLQLWLRADAGVWQDSVGGTPAVNDGDVVGAWEDQSGNGNHATQATTTNKPIYWTNVVNGKPVVRFDGVDDDLALSSSTIMNFERIDTWTFFFVVKLNTSTYAIYPCISKDTGLG
ncbi:MAG: hypothetical protein D6706_10620, partial [Chloroflexi bacterium]